MPADRPERAETPARKSNLRLLLGIAGVAVLLLGCLCAGGAGAGWWFFIREKDNSDRTMVELMEHFRKEGIDGNHFPIKMPDHPKIAEHIMFSG